MAFMNRPHAQTLARFFTRVNFQPGGCWEFTQLGTGGYGTFGGYRAHRLTYGWFVGVIPNGYEIDHTCENPRCVNPVHLDAVTTSEHRTRHWMERRTHCKNGHPWTAENISISFASGWIRRSCRACGRAKTRKWRNARDAATTRDVGSAP